MNANIIAVIGLSHKKLKEPSLINKDLLKFENISWAPIDRDLIEAEMLNEKELQWINEYHHLVYQKISHFLNLEEKSWLQKVTMPL